MGCVGRAPAAPSAPIFLVLVIVLFRKLPPPTPSVGTQQPRQLPTKGVADFLDGRVGGARWHERRAIYTLLRQSRGGRAMLKHGEGAGKYAGGRILGGGCCESPVMDIRQIGQPAPGDELQMCAVMSHGRPHLIQIANVGGFGFQQDDGIEHTVGHTPRSRAPRPPAIRDLPVHARS